MQDENAISVSATPEGWDAALLARLAEEHRRVIHVCRDDARLDTVARCMAFFAPDLTVLQLPAWDCLPYDRVSPRGAIVSQRIETLATLSEMAVTQGFVLLTTVNAVLQRLPPRSFLAGRTIRLRVGQSRSPDLVLESLERNGYLRTGTVREAGEYAVRGGIIDIFPAGSTDPLRLDFFGDDLDGIRQFDAMTQRTTTEASEVRLRPASELLLTEGAVQRFRKGYRANFGARAAEDPLFEAVSAGRRHPGLEHWLPLFHRALETVCDHAGPAAVSLDYQADSVASTRFEMIEEYFATRRDSGTHAGLDGASLYRPLAADALYLNVDEWARMLADRVSYRLSPFAMPDIRPAPGVAIDGGAIPGANFAEAHVRADLNVFDVAASVIAAAHAEGKQVIVAGFSAGSRDRLAGLLRDHHAGPVAVAANIRDARALGLGVVAAVILPINRGFEAEKTLFLAEPELLGQRLSRPSRRQAGAEFLHEVAALADGDFIVHADHGIGRYEGLETLEIAGAPHDCLRLGYAGGDKLFVPVENIDVLSRYGPDGMNAVPDKLGGVAWQARRARVKNRLRDMADQLIRVAAEREMRSVESMTPPPDTYEMFCASFPYDETEDQVRAIDATLDDIASGRPMDRLICGDVGFGKTEVALRAAMVVAMQGFQVALVASTTLLCRQHHQVFTERFAGLPLRVGQLSRLVGTAAAKTVRQEVATGDCNILIGTHAALSKSVSFDNLGLLIVDEEQHFGVAQKERMKEMRSDIHVLTLTATPIPRTLQLALSGVRDMSLIATPPVDRLSIRTFVMPYDGMVIREAVQRERNRGGQTFYVCPRISDLPRAYDRIVKLVPDARVGTVHGRMPPRELESIMSAFCDGAFDVLLSTNIIESGLDIPNANTMIIHRADMFGLAQLYQLRGRVGRSKIRAYAFLTTHPSKVLSPIARRRLEVMQMLDSLGAGFSLASHDMDIRGAGNLLGEEQSGQVKEVGIELYQHMLQEAVQAARSGGDHQEQSVEETWTPQISPGTPVLIPEEYVADLTLRLALYRRIGRLVDRGEIDAFAAEMTDRFGSLPTEVDNLLAVIGIKRLCKSAGIERIDAGPRGAVISFRGDTFSNLPGLLEFLQRQGQSVFMRPDNKLVCRKAWGKPDERLIGLARMIEQLGTIAQSKVREPQVAEPAGPCRRTRQPASLASH